MRFKKPTRVSIDQVRITREGNDAIVDHADAGISGAHLAIGPEIAAMTDADIVDLYNDILEFSASAPGGVGQDGRRRTAGGKTNRLSRKQRSMGAARRRTPLHHRRRRPRGRGHHPYRRSRVVAQRNSAGCSAVHAGWGMRIAFVPEEFVTENPTVKVRKPKRRKR